MKTLKYGDKGEDVKTLQRILNIAVDGVFGIVTKEAVGKFQLEHGLKVDYIVGQNTWRVLNLQSPQTKRKINKIILHCSATIEGKDYSVADIRKWHKANGWSDIGYHWVIYRDGTIAKGRDESIAGAHCEGYNANTIGICYIGGCDKNNKPKDTRTKEQKEALMKLVKEIMEKYHLQLEDVYCHNNFTSKKACPSFSLLTFKEEYLRKYDK